MSTESHTTTAPTATDAAPPLLSRVRPESFHAEYPDGGVLFVQPLQHVDSAQRACGHVGSDRDGRYIVIGLQEDEDDDARRIDKVMLPRQVWPTAVANIDRAIAALQAAREAMV